MVKKSLKVQSSMMADFLRRILPRPVKIRIIQMYHCVLLIRTCKNWLIAVFDRLHVSCGNGQRLLKLRDGIKLSVELSTLDTQIVAEIFGEKVYTPLSLSKYWGGSKFVLDIGANKGVFTLFAATKFPNATIYAYEPDPILFAILRSNILLNSLDKRCILYNSAVWRHGGFLPFAPANPRNPGAGRVVECEKDVQSMIDVPAIALTDILRKHRKIDFVKMDIEGGEYQVILGTPCEALSKIKYLALEYHWAANHDVHELVEHLMSAGFSVMLSSRGSMLYAWQGDMVV